MFGPPESGRKKTLDSRFSRRFRAAGLSAARRDEVLPLAGKDFARSPFRRTQKRNEFHPQVLPLEGKVSPQATEEVSYRKAVRSDGRENGTSSTQSFPSRGRCRRRRRKRCRTGSQFLSTNAKAERRSPLPSSGLRETPDATLPSRGGILRAVRFDGRRSGTKITSSVIRLAGDAGCHPPRKRRDFTRSPLRQAQNRGSKKSQNTPFLFGAHCAIIA